MCRRHDLQDISTEYEEGFIASQVWNVGEVYTSGQGIDETTSCPMGFVPATPRTPRENVALKQVLQLDPDDGFWLSIRSTEMGSDIGTQIMCWSIPIYNSELMSSGGIYNIVGSHRICA